MLNPVITCGLVGLVLMLFLNSSLLSIADPCRCLRSTVVIFFLERRSCGVIECDSVLMLELGLSAVVREGIVREGGGRGPGLGFLRVIFENMLSAS